MAVSLSMKEAEARWRRHWQTLPALRQSVQLALVLSSCFPAKRAGAQQRAPRFATICFGWEIWSGRRDSNPRPQPWQGCALPLSYTRIHARRHHRQRCMPHHADGCKQEYQAVGVRSDTRPAPAKTLYPVERPGMAFRHAKRTRAGIVPVPVSRKAPVAQLDRAPDYESGGQEFESLRARHLVRICEHSADDATSTRIIRSVRSLRPLRGLSGRRFRRDRRSSEDGPFGTG